MRNYQILKGSEVYVIFGVGLMTITAYLNEQKRAM